ncbi:MAG: alpha/beta hydrolase [Victivallales bacterium]|nr:alpha/beta hydrolase [Victivallales bacterium]
MKPFEAGGVAAEVVQEYCDAYGLQATGGKVVLGTLEVSPYTIAFGTITPPNPRATILLVHGYLDNSTTWALTLPTLLQANFRVAFCDLPGLGLSSGASADIDSFQSYVNAVTIAMDTARALAPEQPFYLMGHSTGAGVIADILLHDEARRAQTSGAILVAPLLRSAHWGATNVGMFLAGWAKKEVKATRRPHTSNPSQLDAMKNDPLQSGRIPTHWVKALKQWYKRMKASKATCDLPVLLLEGDRDDVVDWKYNIPYYRAHFPKAEYHLVPGSGHLLHREADAYREQYLKYLQQFLSVPAGQ